MKRYNFGTRDIYPHDNGDWVMYEEVKQLQDAVRALAAEVKAWRECRLWTNDSGDWKYYDTATIKLTESTNANTVAYQAIKDN
jgi:peptidoglycan/xylan/chitin deacetylase (PgdA/CDA1 family)